MIPLFLRSTAFFTGSLFLLGVRFFYGRKHTMLTSFPGLPTLIHIRARWFRLANETVRSGNRTSRTGNRDINLILVIILNYLYFL